MAKKLYYSMGEVTEMFAVEPSLIRYWCTQFSCLRPKRNAKGNRMFSPQDIERLKRIHHLLKEKKMTIEGAQKAMRKSAIEAEKNDSDMALLEQLQTLRAMLVDMRQTIGDDTPLEDIEVDIKPSVVEEVEETTEETVEEPLVQDTIAESAPVAESVDAEQPAVEEVAKEVTIDDVFVEEAKEAAVEPVEEPIEEVVVEPVAEESEVETQATEKSAEPSIGLFADVALEQPAAEQTIAEQPVAEEQLEESQAEPVQKKKRASRRKLKGEEGVVERPLFPFYEQTLF